MASPARARAPPISAESSAKQLKVTKKMLQNVLEQCNRAMELLENAEIEEGDDDVAASSSNSASDDDVETDELCDLLKSKVESSDFLEKLGTSYISVSSQMCDESATWDVINRTETWEDKNIGVADSEDDGFVLVKQEDIVEGIACFMATYLSSLEQTKELTPKQLQAALCKTFSIKKRKGKIRKAWEGSIIVYNVTSWGATAVGMYQNPALFRAASTAFWSSCRVISKLL